MKRCLVVLLFTFGLVCSVLGAETVAEHPCIVAPSIDPASAKKWEDSGLPIGKIEIDTSPVFDESNPDENNWLYRWVNRLHIDTDHDVVKDDLLFKEGDIFSAYNIAESERILRRRAYLRNAKIESLGDCENKVDLKVTGREVWTLLPEIGYSHKGGGTTSRFGVRDQNFFGTGKSVTVQREVNPERTSSEFSYRDPNFTSLRAVVDIEYASSSDGQSLKTELERPFYSLEVPWSAALRTLNDDKVVSIYRDGDKVFDFGTKRDEKEMAYGWLFHSTSVSADRLFLGYSHQSETFSENMDTVDIEYFPMPLDRDYHYAWFGYNRYTSDFIKASNINQMGVVEDLNSSWIISSRFGFGKMTTTSMDGTKIDDDLYVLSLNFNRKLLFGESSVAEFQFDLDSKINSDGPFDTVTDMEIRYHQGDFETSQFYAIAKYVHGIKLPLDHLEYLGGENGLRGYPRNYTAGENSLLLTAEKRFYIKREWLALADVGAVFFFDAGKTDGRDDFDSRWLKDVGFGLRLTPTRTGSHRSGSNTVVHLDIAFPLDERDIVGNWQWLVQAKNSF